MTTHETARKHVVIVGGGFGGISAAQNFAKAHDVRVTLIDRRNHHLFQPLLYQVAMAGLSPAEIAPPIRSVLDSCPNVSVTIGDVSAVHPERQSISGDFGEMSYDYLLLAAGATTSYFGHPEWEAVAPGLKSLEQATEIRCRVLLSFEWAEREKNIERQKQLLTFVIVGGGPTGVELAGAIGELSRYTLVRDFKQIDSRKTRIILIEGSDRILSTFRPSLSARAMRDLEGLGVQVWTNSIVTEINRDGVRVGNEFIQASTVLWAAGIKASPLGATVGVACDRMGRICVNDDLSTPNYPNVFVVGDLASFINPKTKKPLPAVASVALQSGPIAAKNILHRIRGEKTEAFRYFDKGQMATIGRKTAVVDAGAFIMTGYLAWLSWLFIHIYYLIGMENKLLVFIQWAWAYFSYKRGARLIMNTDWKEVATTSKKNEANSPTA